MKVVVIHNVTDPKGLQAQFEQVQQNGVSVPEGIKLAARSFAADLSKSVCIREGPSVEAIQEVVESLVGSFTKNEYFQAYTEGIPEE